MCAQGRGGPKDERRARELYAKADAGGDLQASHNARALRTKLNEPPRVNYVLVAICLPELHVENPQAHVRLLLQETRAESV